MRAKWKARPGSKRDHLSHTSASMSRASVFTTRRTQILFHAVDVGFDHHIMMRDCTYVAIACACFLHIVNHGVASQWTECFAMYSTFDTNMHVQHLKFRYAETVAKGLDRVAGSLTIASLRRLSSKLFHSS